MKTIFTSILVFITIFGFSQDNNKIQVGKKAHDFTLYTVNGDKIILSELTTVQPVVLVVLRGWPGYQCPVCTRQVGGLVENSDNFLKYNAVVLMVYPGPAEELKKHALEFAEDFQFPNNFYFTLDPDYSMINSYGLRWNAPSETAYPSTFVINKEGIIVFSKISSTHGGRANNEEIFNVLENLQ